ncbi:MAG TPA: oxygenase MpaB family protein, partial [Ktedonobacteraceae bacterium]
NYGTYGPGSVAWKINRESAVMLGGARAVLMQIAHPLVAMGVSAHSNYMTDPFGRAERTFVLGEVLTFGSFEKARQAARSINRMHLGVHGDLPIDAGAFEKGTRYDARNPELLLWVHATLVDTLLLCYTLFIGRLTPAEQETYYQESKEVAHLLGLLPDKMPGTVVDLRQYVDDMVHSNRLVATPQARQLAHQVLFPPAPAILRPFMHLNLQLTCALLPQPIREIYGLEWNTGRQHLFDLSAGGMRVIIPRLPMYLRELPITRRLIQETTGHPLA